MRKEPKQKKFGDSIKQLEQLEQEAEKKAKDEADHKVQEEVDRKGKGKADRNAREDTDRRVKEKADSKAEERISTTPMTPTPPS